MTTRAEIARKVNQGYVGVFLKRRLPDGTYEDDWLDITRLVVGGGAGVIDFSLDSDDFDVGRRKVGSVDLLFNNAGGQFNDVMDSRSLWASLETRHLSKVSIEAGYLDSTTGEQITEVAFSGLLNDQSFESAGDDQMKATLLEREYAFSTLSVVPGTFNSSVTVSEAIVALCSRGEILAHMNVLAANVSPGNDIVLDNPSVYGTRKLDSVLTELLLVSNSVMFVDEDDNLIVRSRAHLNKVAFRFYQNSPTGKADNIYKLSKLNAGRQRVKNLWAWQDNSVSSISSVEHQSRYGVTRKSIGSEAVSDDVVKKQITDALLAEWQYPKREVEIETDYLANEVAFFDLVTLDVAPPFARVVNLPISGLAVAGVDRVTTHASGILIEARIGWKVLGIRHDLKNFKTTLKLREKGTQLNDGYLSMATTKNTDVVFAAGVDTTKDIDVSIFGMNAQKTMAEAIDPADSFSTLGITVSRPDINTVRLTVGAAFVADKTIRLLLVETED